MNKNEIEKRAFAIAVQLEKRAEDGESRQITGYAAVFDSWSNPLSWFREKINRDAFKETDFSNCILCFNHDWEKIMARTSSGTLKLEVDKKGLKFSAELPDTTVGNDILELVKRGDISQCSFAFHVKEDKWVYADDKNGLELDEREILAIDSVYDVCPVVYPAYDDTSVDARSLEQRKADYIKQNDNSADADAKAETESRNRQYELLTL